MTTRILSATALLAVGLALSPLASAYGMNDLKQSAGDMTNSQGAAQTSGGAGALLGQLTSGSMNLGSVQNAAGVLGYCQKQGYTKSATEQIKNKLMAKLGGPAQATRSQGYKQGMSGLLQGGQGQTFSLTNLKHKLGERVCGAIADKAMSSFLGG
ncbi:MAG: DUF2501 domain-containing protein [Salinisphaera sp.]|jgi:hypothetical protein|nr:DUF2501 domain-containing protein [Salinisphaera sp.]